MNIWQIIEKKDVVHKKKMFAIIVKVKVIGQINVKMLKEKEDVVEVEVIENVVEVVKRDVIDHQVVQEEIEREEEDQIAVVNVVVLVVNREVKVAKVILNHIHKVRKKRYKVLMIKYRILSVLWI